MSDSRPVSATASFDDGLTLSPEPNDRRTGNLADTRPRPAASAVRTRRARLRISRVDPWSVMKTSFLFSIAGGIMTWVAVYVIWTLLGASGMFEAIDAGLTMLLSNPQDQTPVRMEDFVNTNRVMGITALFAVVNVILLTALGTIFAFLYNLSANILGGLELTLAED
ncbi:DUF3566 domain-containing protein [Propioniciclava soli]|uniref:DUF3566 domain-containing protein n=1 Tax=Propioniciclava soli TaxID=2775081 RepID=UPI001E37D848